MPRDFSDDRALYPERRQAGSADSGYRLRRRGAAGISAAAVERGGCRGGSEASGHGECSDYFALTLLPWSRCRMRILRCVRRTAHHLTLEEIVALIRNVGRTCRRFVIQDLIRHPLPLVLFTVFLCPLIGREAAVDGRQSIRRAFTPAEFAEMVRTAIAGTRATFTTGCVAETVAADCGYPFKG